MALEVIAKDFYTPSTPVPGAPFGVGSYDLLYDKNTGEVQLKQSGLTLSPAILYQDGSYRANGLKIPELSPNGIGLSQKANDLNNQIIQTVKTAATVSKGVVPQFVLQNSSPGTNNSFPGTNASIPNALPGGSLLSASPGEFFKDIENLNFKPSNETSALVGGKYPSDILDGQQDILKITQYNYKPPTGDAFLAKNGSGVDLSLKGGLQRNSALLGNALGVVVLPIPNNIQDSNNVAWGPDTINDLSAAIASKAVSDPEGFGLKMGLITAGTALANKAFGTSLPAGALRAIEAYRSVGAIDSPLVRPAIASYLLKTAGVEVSPETILSRGFGVVPNSNMELLFNAPTLRSFTFAYRLTPRSDKEATQVRRILRFFKQGMAPKKINSGGGVGSRSLFLGTPNVFKLEYQTVGNKSIKGLNKFKICALTGFSVNYAPDGSWASYDDPNAPGQPVSLTMNMSFQEIEPVYSDDYDDRSVANGLTRDDLPSIGLDDIGY